MDHLERALNIIQDDIEWAHNAIVKSIQSASIYGIAMSASSYLNQIADINELIAIDPSVDLKPRIEKAEATFLKTAVGKASLYNITGARIPQESWLNIDEVILDISRGSSFATSMGKSQQQSQMHKEALELFKEELDITDKQIEFMMRQAEEADKERRDSQLMILRDNLNAIKTITREAMECFNAGVHLDPFTELNALQKVAQKVEEYKNRKLIDMMRSRNVARSATAMADFKLLKETQKEIEPIVSELEKELDSTVMTGEPSEYAARERIERFNTVCHHWLPEEYAYA